MDNNKLLVTRTNYGHLVKKIRLDNNMTQKELAIMVGVHPSYISRLERNSVNPRITTYLKIIHELGYTIDITR
jgi:transcriptional regulator with XRE-family HTH domain